MGGPLRDTMSIPIPLSIILWVVIAAGVSKWGARERRMLRVEGQTTRGHKTAINRALL